ncbi:hypothetical protein, partial [Rhizobium leguminosarum]|uniref:hypothetical protein n=1 Tax=Rhizobium leguminosarum TaxID=384 RepID=UPI003F9BB766
HSFFEQSRRLMALALEPAHQRCDMGHRRGIAVQEFGRLGDIAGVYRFLGRLPDQSIAFTAEPKIDGLSMSIRYENGRLVTAATR